MIYFIVYYSGVDALLLKIITHLKKEHLCIILLYHQIVDDNTKFLSKGPIVHHNIKCFEKEISYLRKHYEIADMDEVVESIRTKKAFKKPTVAITFDDGYLNNYTLGYPVLQKYGVKATIYLATSLIGTSGRTWTDQIEAALLATSKTDFSLPEVFGEKNIPISTNDEKKKANIMVAQALKSLQDSERRKQLRKFFEVLQFDENALNDLPRVMLNWDEVKEMANNGITFGSHSHTHPILSRMKFQEAKNDILTSKRILENVLAFPIKHFAYPNGRIEDFSEPLREYCREIGFESIATVVYGTNDAENSDVFALKRIGAVSPLWLFAGELLLANLRGYLSMK